MKFRLLFHAFLAIFTGAAQVKINMPEVVSSFETDFNGRLILLVGDAPDQFRVLPFLLMRLIFETVKLVFPAVSVNAILQIFYIGSAFLVFEIGHLFLTRYTTFPARKRLIISLLFAVGQAYTQLFYWKPDTLFGLSVCLAAVWFFLGKNRFGSLVSLVVLAFCRADVALLYGLFFSIFVEKTSWTARFFVVIFPLGVQFVLQKIVFSEAHYFCPVFQYAENLKFYFLLVSPTTWLILAVLALFFEEITSFFKKNWSRWKWAFLLMIAYVGLICLVARLNEWRLYLPFGPLFLLISIFENEEKRAHRTF